MLRRRVMRAPFEVLPQTRSAPGDRRSPGGASFLPPVADYVVRGRRRHSRQPVCAYACRTCGDDIEALVATALALAQRPVPADDDQPDLRAPRQVRAGAHGDAGRAG